MRAEDFTPDIYWGQHVARRARRRPRTRIGRILRRVFGPTFWMLAFGALMGPVVLLLCTPDARADSADAAFLAVLAADGFQYDHGNTDKVIHNGRQVCALLTAGVAPFDIVAVLDATEPGMDQQDSAEFAALANAVYCPDFGAGVSVT